MRLCLALALLAAPAFAAEQRLDYTNFSAIEAKEGVSVYIEVGPIFTVTARTDEGDLDYLTVKKFGQWLVFNRDSRWWFLPNGRDDKFEIIITLPELTEVKALDFSAVTVVGGQGETLRAEASKNGDLILQGIDYTKTTLVVTDGGTLSATGNCAGLAFLNADVTDGADCTVELAAGVGEEHAFTLPEQPEEDAAPEG
jgi:hypothetical protein